jgi:hypothetical protein
MMKEFDIFSFGAEGDGQKDNSVAFANVRAPRFSGVIVKGPDEAFLYK